MDEAHKGEETSVRPTMDGNTTQVHKLVLVSYVVQTLHLVFNLHLTLIGGEQRCNSPGVNTLSLPNYIHAHMWEFTYAS